MCGTVTIQSVWKIDVRTISWIFEQLLEWPTVLNELDNSGLMGTIIMDLSKACDCLHHDLLTAKLETYGLDKPSLKLVDAYLRF